MCEDVRVPKAAIARLPTECSSAYSSKIRVNSGLSYHKVPAISYQVGHSVSSGSVRIQICHHQHVWACNTQTSSFVVPSFLAKELKTARKVQNLHAEQGVGKLDQTYCILCSPLDTKLSLDSKCILKNKSTPPCSCIINWYPISPQIQHDGHTGRTCQILLSEMTLLNC